MAQLTPRERQVGQLLAFGLTSEEIARQLGLTLSTVRSHTSALRSKLGVHRTIYIVPVMRKLGYLEEDE